MVVGGATTNETELISLEPESHPVPSCLRNLQPYPYMVRNAVGGAVAGGMVPLVCTGYVPNGGLLGDCLQYNAHTDLWLRSGSLPPANVHNAAGSVHPRFGLLVSGGVDTAEAEYAAVRSTLNGAEFRTTHASLPVPRKGHCQTLANDDTLLVFGGMNDEPQGTDKAFKLDMRYMTIA